MWRRLGCFAIGWWQSQVNRRILMALLTVTAVTLILHLTVALREITIAYHFGTGDSIDAFIVAFIVPSFAINIQIAAITAALMPVFVRIRDRNGEMAARRLAENALLAVCLMLIVTTAILAFAGAPIVRLIGSGFDAEKQALTLRLLQLLLPVILLQGVIRCLASFINAGRRFAVVAAAPMATPLLTIALLLTVPQAGVDLLVAGVVGGSVIELVILAIQAHRLAVPILPRWHGFDPPTRMVMGQYLPTMLAALTGGASMMVDQSMAAMLAPGSVASLNYGGKLIAAILTLTAGPLSAAILPYLSQLAAERDVTRLRQSLTGWIGLAVALALPVSAIMYVFSEPVIRLVFERGAFTGEDTVMVARIQACYALQIPFYLAGVLGARLLNAMSLNQVTALIGIMNLVTNIVFNLLFIRWFGLPGIALSTAAVYACSSIVVLWVARSCLNRMQFQPIGASHAP